MSNPNTGAKGLFWSRVRKYPPFLVRLLARRKHGPPLTDEQIATASGLSVYEVSSISQCKSWEEIRVWQMRQFLVGCQIDFTDGKCMKRLKNYLKTPARFRHLRKSEQWTTVYEPLIRKFTR